jgi:hypothetical protein
MDINSNLGKKINLDDRTQGTLIGTLNRLLSPQRERDVTSPSFTNVGSATSADLSPERNRDVRPQTLAPTPPKDYSMPGLDPNGLVELKRDLWGKAGVSAGMGDDNPVRESVDPNSLQGRMTSPNYEVDKRNQMQEAQDMSDKVSLRPNAQKKKTPFSTLFPGRQT